MEQTCRGYVTSLERGVHWWGEKRIKTCTQSNDHSVLTWHLISHGEKHLVPSLYYSAHD